MPRTRAPRQHDFFFSPRDYLRDPAVLAMRDNAAARGAYSTLLFELWDQDEPGVVVDSDPVIAALAWVTVSEWSTLRVLVSEAFDTTSRPGFWVQKRMVAEHQRQDGFYRSAEASGRLGGLEKARRHPIGTLQAPYRHPLPTSSASPASPAKEEPTPSPRAARSAVVGEPVGFTPWYSSYPRHVARRAAMRAYRAALGRATEDVLLSGAQRYAEESSGRDVEKVKHPATWLNGDCWLDDPSSNGTPDSPVEEGISVARMKANLAKREADREIRDAG